MDWDTRLLKDTVDNDDVIENVSTFIEYNDSEHGLRWEASYANSTLPMLPVGSEVILPVWNDVAEANNKIAAGVYYFTITRYAMQAIRPNSVFVTIEVTLSKANRATELIKKGILMRQKRSNT
jgi:predicted P-loop ATPase